MQEVRTRRSGTTRITAKHQVTLPIAALDGAGLAAGERLVVCAYGPGRVLLVRESAVLADLGGTLAGVYADGELDALRDEWG